MSIRNFSTTPNLNVIPDFKEILTKEEFALLKQGWREHLKREGWACPRFNLVYALFTGNPISEAFSPLVNPNKLKSNPLSDPWYFVNSRLKIMVSDAKQISGNPDNTWSQKLLKEWWTPWIELLPAEKFLQLSTLVSTNLIERK